MVSVAPRRASYGDLLALPRNVVGEIIGGELHTQPRPGAPHAAVASLLGMVLGNPFHRGSGGPGGWIILDEPELHLGADILVPDLAGWRRTPMPEVPDAAAFNLAPNWVAEILSPSTAALDRVQKLPIYTRENVSHVWLIDPRLRTLEVFALSGDRYELLGAWRDSESARGAPFEELELGLAALWAR
jgi:Uma2 family endonuclease